MNTVSFFQAPSCAKKNGANALARLLASKIIRVSSSSVAACRRRFPRIFTRAPLASPRSAAQEWFSTPRGRRWRPLWKKEFTSSEPNFRELSELVGVPLEDEAARVDACRRLTEAGRAEIVALTLGDRGALLVTRDHAWRALALPIKPVSAVGAGDSFLGAMVWGLAKGMSIEDAFCYGVAAGSAALLSPGTGLCRWEDVERLYPDVVRSRL